jgi:hypothetical protein
MSKSLPVTLLLVLLAGSGAVGANSFEAPLRALVDSHIKEWAGSGKVTEAVKAQNTAHAGLSQGDIDRLDKQWREETGGSSRPLVEKVLANELSRFLREVKEKAGGLYTEIFVMDNRGLNVGQSDVTSDYWQGDEDKWKQTFLVGPDAVHMSEVEQDESTQMFQAQLSIPVVDPASREVIGAVTVGINVDELP